MPTSAAVSTSDKIWKILESTNATLDKTNATLENTNATLDKTNATLDKTAARQERNSRKMEEFRISQEESSRKASREIAAIRAIQEETNKQIKKTEALFNSQWGRLMESLVEGDLIALLREKGINALRTYKNVEQRGTSDDFEYDIVAANGEEIVVVEVKTTLRVKDVRDFLISLRKFTSRMKDYQGKTVYGAVAWLQAHEEAATYAEKQGLFVIRATGSSASIVNREDFKPQAFS